MDGLLASLGRFSEKYAVLGAHLKGDSITVRTTKIGPPLIFDRLWRKRGVDAVLGELLQARKFEFAVERAGCLTARNPGWSRPIIWMSATRSGELRTSR